MIEFPLEVYKNLEIQSKLKLRIVYGVTMKPYNVCKKNITEQMHKVKRNRVMYTTKLFDISIVKFLVDGVIETMTAYLFKPYKLSNKNNGIFLWEEEELKSGIKMANMLDFNVYIHASGDFACKTAIDGVEYSLKNNINNDYRNTLVNIELITRYYMRKMKILNINAIIKPFWFYKDVGSSKNEVAAIGEERAYRQYPVKSLIDEGVLVAGGSDNDIIENASPLKAIECVTLRNLYDFISLGYPKIIDMTDIRYRLNPGERISIAEAINMFTINAANVLGKEKEIGSLEIGKKADFIILDKDIFSINPLEIGNINIDRTYFNGELVYLNE